MYLSAQNASGQRMHAPHRFVSGPGPDRDMKVGYVYARSFRGLPGQGSA